MIAARRSSSRPQPKRLWPGWVLALSLAAAATVVGAADYGDIKYQRKAAGMDDVPSAIFPHWVHRLQFKCGACHNEPFKMKAGANPVTMDDIQAGRSCGVCHNGTDAFVANFDSCSRCHRK